MTDMDPRTAPGDAAMPKSLQDFASEMQRLSQDAMDQTTQHLQYMERLRRARTIEDVISIQTAFLRQSFANYADYTRRFSELMMTLPMELARQGHTAFQQGSGSVTQAAEHVGEEARLAGEQVSRV